MACGSAAVRTVVAQEVARAKRDWPRLGDARQHCRGANVTKAKPSLRPCAARPPVHLCDVCLMSMPTLRSAAQESACSLAEGRSSLQVLILCETAPSRLAAARLLRGLARTLGTWLDLRASWSSLDLLFHPAQRQRATRALHNADIVLFSISRRAVLPLAVKAWLETELRQRTGACGGLLALLETGEAKSPPCSSTRLFLRAVARCAGLDFLTSGVEEELRPVEFRFLSATARRVCVAGEFNGWDAETLCLRRAKDGQWRGGAWLPPGRFKYRFVVNGHRQDDAQACGVISNGHAACHLVLEVT